ncbi:hypothetical protein C8Q74DRAFT_1448614, partial [Fomes fomentarius]
VGVPPPPGKPDTTVIEGPSPVVVHDARGREDEFSLDKSGFQFVKHLSTEREFTDEERIKKVYYKEVEELLKNVTGAKKVIIFDHTIRRLTGTEKDVPAEGRGPVERVHVDQTYESAVIRVHQVLGKDKAEHLLKSRYRLINVWRPIANPVYHKPLAVSDWRYLDESKDLVPVKITFSDRIAGLFSIRYNPAHQWWYLALQTPEEVTLIKCYDSRTDVARFTPHSAFFDSTSPVDAPQRQSIELRVFVFDEDAE